MLNIKRLFNKEFIKEVIKRIITDKKKLLIVSTSTVGVIAVGAVAIVAINNNTEVKSNSHKDSTVASSTVSDNKKAAQEKKAAEEKAAQEKKVAEEKAAQEKKVAEEKVTQEKAEQEQAAAQEQTNSTSDNSSSNSSSGNSNDSTSGNGTSQQIQQVSFNEGIDSALTSAFYASCAQPNRTYYGVKSGELDSIAVAVANGQMSCGSAINQISSMTWKENGSSAGFPDGTYDMATYDVQVTQINVGYASNSEMAMTINNLIGSYNGIVAYRHADGSATITTVTCYFTGSINN